MSEPLEVRVLCWNVREWDMAHPDVKPFCIAEHIIGLEGVPVGSTIVVTDYVAMGFLWKNERVYEATAKQYDVKEGKSD